MEEVASSNLVGSTIKKHPNRVVFLMVYNRKVTLGEAFKSFNRDALRIETLPTYNVPEEAKFLDSLRRGEEPDLSFLKEWHDYLDELAGTPRVSKRIRLLHNPPSEYEKVELRWAYPSNAKHGEQIRLGRIDMLEKPIDVWIFDDELGFEMVYDNDGSFREANPLIYEQIQQYVDWANKVWPYLKPL
jgi:hypothetical protein